MSIATLATAIHDHTGMEGAELEAYTFYVCACLADLTGTKAAQEYFTKRLAEATAKWKERRNHVDH